MNERAEGCRRKPRALKFWELAADPTPVLVCETVCNGVGRGGEDDCERVAAVLGAAFSLHNGRRIITGARAGEI